MSTSENLKSLLTPPEPIDYVPYAIKLPKEVLVFLRSHAKKHKVSTSSLVRKALCDWIDTLPNQA